MTRRMTDDQAGRLAVKANPFAFNITTSPGLQLRVSPGGRKAWSLRYQFPNGKQKRRTLGTFVNAGPIVRRPGFNAFSLGATLFALLGEVLISSPHGCGVCS